jgi:hypothetical protein
MQRIPSITSSAYSYTVRQPERTIRYIKTYDEAHWQARLSASALQGPFLGFDIEWRPNFDKNAPPSKVALIQLASKHEVLLFQIFRAGKLLIPSEVHYHVLANLRTWPLGQLPPALQALLRDTNTKKVGVGIKGTSRFAFPIHAHLSPPSLQKPISQNSNETGTLKCGGLWTSLTLHGNWIALTGTRSGPQTSRSPLDSRSSSSGIWEWDLVNLKRYNYQTGRALSTRGKGTVGSPSRLNPWRSGNDRGE